MENQSDFYAFYNRVLRAKVARIEQLRQHTLTIECLITVATLAATVIWGIVFSHKFGLNPWSRLAFLSYLIPLGIGAAISSPPWRRYRDEYQMNLIEAIVQHFNASFTYDRNGAVEEISIIQSGLFRRDLNRDGRRCNGTDRVSGKIGDTFFEYSDLDVSIPNGKNRKQVFRGVFFVADFNKNFSGETFVTSRHALLHLALEPETPSGEAVKLEDPEFENTFATHSSSQIEARYILTPALMRRILHFSQQCKAPIGVAFRGKNMFIAMYGVSTKLEPTLMQSLLKPSLFFGIWANLEFLCGIVNEMDLNTRIWTKSAQPASASRFGVVNVSSPN